MIDEVEPICRRNDDYLFRGVESIHLIQKLIDSRSSLMRIPKVVHSATQSIDLIDKNDAALLTFPSRSEELPHSLRSNSHEHLLELRGNDSKELAARFVSQSPCEHGLASAWWTVEEDSPSDSGSHLLILLGFSEEINGLSKFFFDVLTPKIVFKRSVGFCPYSFEINASY